jgi:GTP-binding protein
VPADADDIRTEYETLLHELEKYNPDLLKKNRLLAISKADMLDEELETALRAEIEDLDPLFFSSVAQKGLQQLKDRIWQAMESATIW